MGSANALNKVQDEGVILSLLQGIKDNNSEVYIWRFLGGNKHLALVKLEAIRKQRGDFCIIPQDGQDRMVQDLIGSLNHLDLYVPAYSLLLRCNIKQTDAPFRYYLEIPLFVAQLERRQSLRLKNQDESEIKVSFGKTTTVPKMMTQHFHKSSYDLSTGGVSFNVSKAESKLFLPEDKIKSLELKAGKWTSKLDCEVISITEVEPDEFNGLSYKVWRVACRFTQIDQISKKYLEKFIFERIKDELHVINK